jgi:hypothetical protein
MTFTSQWLRLHQSVAFISYWPWSVSSLGQSFAFASSTLHQSVVLMKHSTFVRYLSDPLSVNDFYQSTAFVYQQPLLFIGFHHLSVAFT